MKNFYTTIIFLFLLFSATTQAQQLPNNHFEDWSGEKFDGNIQPASWNYCNVTQTVLGIDAKFNFAHQESGRNGGYCMMVQDQDLKVASIGETSPGYVTLGKPWVYLNGVEVSKATAGTCGGITWGYRPDTMAVWIKRTGSNAMNEDFHLLYYSWSGTAYGERYKGKDGSCSETSKTDEESDIRQSTDGNECGTTTVANQIAEGWLCQRAVYNDWTLIKVPIFYANNDVPEKMNIIFSASNYPNFRANSGLYAGNSLYIDDVELIYSSKIHQLIIGGDEWKSFNPNSTKTQTYILEEGVNTIPSIKAMRGAGQLTNSHGVTTVFRGRQLQGNEISIIAGEIDKTPTQIIVKSEDGKSETTYQIQFAHKASNNAYLGGLIVNGQGVKGFSQYSFDYTVDVEFGTTGAPIIDVVKQEENQQVEITQPTSLSDIATIVVTAADGQTKKTYTVRFKQALLSDNTLMGILVNGVSLPDFTPSRTSYNVSIPLGTTQMPTVTPLSKYAQGLQTIVTTAPSVIDGGVYKIAVSTPGNPVAKEYKLTFKLELSSYCKLQNIYIDGLALTDFTADNTIYAIALPMGTTSLPKITWDQGDPYQTAEIFEGGLDGTTRIVVTAANGNQLTYRLNFSTAKSTICTLDGILLDGQLLSGFDQTITTYNVALPIGTTSLPQIEVMKGDPYQTAITTLGGLNGTTRITVVAGDGSTKIYQLVFSVEQATNATLLGITIDGTPLLGFDPNTLEYYYDLPQGTTQLPLIEYTAHDPYQTITSRSDGVNGDYRITVRPQSGASKTYIIHFSVHKSSNSALKMIYLDGRKIENFDANQLDYVDTVETAQVPNVTYDSEPGQKIFTLFNNNVYSIKVTAENGTSRTYTITFVVRVSQNAFLQMIYLNGDSLDGFVPERLNYADIPVQNQICPIISVDSELGQQITILSPSGTGTASIIVTAESGDHNTYLIHFVDTTTTHISPLKPNPIYTPSTDVTLKAILVNGDTMSAFSPNQVFYTLDLPAGDTIPMVTFIPNTPNQTVISGRTSNNQFSAFVTAENGDTLRYIVTINIALYDNALLQDLSIDGQSFSFDPTTFEYYFTLAEGESLPQLTYTAYVGASAMFYTPDADHQRIIVTTQSGKQNIYNITYTREVSSYALLEDIRIDGQKISNFDPYHFNYVDTLAWHTKVVPMINVIPGNNRQIITTAYSAVNGTTHIHVIAADGKTTADYTIEFPVDKSSNVLLENISLETDYSIDFDFSPQQTRYIVTIPYNATMSPIIRYEKAESEQSISVVIRPIGQLNEIKVQAENGDTLTYFIQFQRAQTPSNQLKAIQYVLNTQNSKDLTLQENQYDYTIELPYGTTAMDIAYTKAFDEQTVIVQPGGIYHPTILNVYSNLADTVVTYTFTPRLSKQCPAVFAKIIVNGNKLEDFDPNRFSYIVPVYSKPIVSISEDGINYKILINDGKHWQAQVTKDGYTNTYDLWFYYPNDIIPNGEFTQWTTAKYNNAEKPEGWQMFADYFDKCSAWKTVCLGSNYSDEHLEKSGTDKVHLITEYKCNMARAVPSFITLGTISGEYNTSATFQVSGGITFRNSPDNLLINYKQDKVANNNLIRYEMTGDNGYYKQEWTSNQTNDFTTFSHNLNAINDSVGNPKSLNITINSYYSFTGDLGNGKTSASMYLDYVRFAYNNTLNHVWVNSKEAHKVDNTFSYTLPTSTDDALPQLRFEGEVTDQAQKVEWQEPVVEGTFNVRRATITNYGEDGLSSEYILEVKRPIDTNSSLKALQIGNIPLAGFKADQYNYTYTLSRNALSLPDVMPVLTNKFQTCSVDLKDSTVSIVVMSESGLTRTYTIQFQLELVEDNSLQEIIADGIVFNPDKTDYSIEASTMPVISIAKRYDEQIVTIHQGIVDVVLPSSSNKQYTIQLHTAAITTSGQLQELELDGNLLADFNPNTYTYKHSFPSDVRFKRVDDIDSVVYIRKPDTLLWHVFGSTPHTYELVAIDELSGSTALQGIYIDNELVEGFNSQIDSYTLYTDSAVMLSAIGIDSRQQISIAYTQSTYQIDVTASDGSATATYTLQILPTTSANPQLKAIIIDGQMIDFQPDRYKYTIELALTNQDKDHEPIIPSINFVPSHPKTSVEIEANRLGETTYLLTTSPDGTQTAQYELFFKSESSHQASLSAIAVNNVPLINFQPDRLYYSVQTSSQDIAIDWRSLDCYQTVTLTNEGNLYTLHVLAQDGRTYKNYQIEVYTEELSNDATISNLMLDGLDMNAYHSDLNPDLSFSPGLNKYTIFIPFNLANLPDVSATLKLDGQSIKMVREQKTISLIITAPDGSTQNTYVLQFTEMLSKNTSLSGLILDTIALDTFDPSQHFYYITLPTGQHNIPDVTPIKIQQTQQVSMSTSSLPIGQQVLIDVTAEDGISSSQYRILFQFSPSEADTLRMIYADGEPLVGFTPQIHQYTFELSRTISVFPTISWEEADKYQTIVVDTLEHTSMRLTCDLIVSAESGKISHYQVTYFKQPSSITILKNIFINNQALTKFDSHTNEYIITLSAGERLDTIYWEEADPYQTITIYDTISMLVPNSIATKQIHVVAENGDSRTYTLCFVKALSTDSTLSMIYYNGTPVSPDFEDLRTNYAIQLSQHNATLPLITYSKKDPHQSVDIYIIDSLHIHVLVTSADSLHHCTYTLTFLPYQSSNALLDTLYLSNGSLAPEFSAITNDYDIQVDSIQHLPVIGYKLAEPEYQQIQLDTTYTHTALGLFVNITLRVIAENQVDYTDYTIKIYITSSRPRTPEDSENALLSAIHIRQQLLNTQMGFDHSFEPDSTTYRLLYPIGSNPESFYSVDDISATAQDSLAKVIYATDTLQFVYDSLDAHRIAVNTCIHITVLAPAGNSRTYTLYQELLLDSINHVTDLVIADANGTLQSLPGFNPNIYYYEYTLSETATNTPQITLRYDNTSSRFASVRVDYSNNSRIVDCTDLINYADDNTENDPTYHIYYRAENGTKYLYKIKFRRSEIKRSVKPMEGDVLIQPIPGSSQIAVASLRANVVFGLYDMSGRMVEFIKLPEGDPNSFVTTTDGYGQTYFSHLTDYSACTIITLEPNKIYFWVFTENGKRNIKSGKIILLP